MSDLSQEDRIGKLTTPAGGDVFVLNRFEATEATRRSCSSTASARCR